MMPIKETNNDQNINRVNTKMSEDCTSQNNNTNLTDCVENINYLTTINNAEDKDDLNSAYDHMYATNADNSNLNCDDSNCQNAESEVKFLKEWLLLHLDLIQQQNNEILNKEKTILLLKRENEMLRERINCLDQGIPFEDNNLSSRLTEDYLCENSLEEMTQDAAHIEDDENEKIYFLDSHNDTSDCVELENYNVTVEDNEDSNSCNQPENTSANCDTNSPVHVQSEETVGNKIDSTSQPVTLNDSTNNPLLNFDNSNYIVNSSVEDTLKNLKMSIRRKRLCSSSSALSNNEVGMEEPRSSRKKRKRKHSVKDEKMLTSNEQYVTQTGEVTLTLPFEPEPATEIPSATKNLEVPRWRVKVYTSCYTMEGTENLDDEVYNKRHIRLESDERRRKRWDVQRIREQRIIEKLKQRQERVGSGSRADDHSEPITSLWPSLEDIKYLEVCDELPVSAFGVPIPRFVPSEFSLPWLNSSSEVLKKNSSRKMTVRRKGTKR